MQRFWEIDFLRGLAVVMMIFFHLLYDINYFQIASLQLQGGFWLLFGRATAVLFLLISGVSLHLSSFKKTKQQTIKRGLEIFLWGLVITAVTLLLPKGTIYFGVLHLIGLSVIIGWIFLRFKYLNLFLGLVIIISGLYLSNFIVDIPWLLWLGLKPLDFYSFDYFPLLPWFGVFLMGIFLGKFFYPEHKRIFKLPEINMPLEFLGKNSLFIYLVHQPILVLGIILFV